MITHTQYGFKPGSTTVDCLVDLIEEISTYLDQGDYAVSIFLDLSKAFDTANHSILLSKLLSYGIQKPHINWFKSYLNKRKQRVFVNGNISDTMPITSGVPKGSILGPLLFLICINDFTQSYDFFYMRLFADDTSLTASAKNIDELLFDHIDYVCDRVSKSINIMTKIKSYLGNQCLTSIYYSLVYPYLIYGSLLRGNN